MSRRGAAARRLLAEELTGIEGGTSEYFKLYQKEQTSFMGMIRCAMMNASEEELLIFNTLRARLEADLA